VAGTPQEFRLGVGIFLINSEGKVFVGQRLDKFSEAWQMPQGGIDEGEDPLQAVYRELEEEIGTSKATIIAQTPDWLSYDLPQELIPQFWGGKFRGQKQKWFLMKLDGPDELINIATEVPEFKEWKWLEPALLPSVIVDFKKDLYQNVLDQFSSYIK